MSKQEYVLTTVWKDHTACLKQEQPLLHMGHTLHMAILNSPNLASLLRTQGANV